MPSSYPLAYHRERLWRHNADILQVSDSAVELRFKERLMFNLPIVQPKVPPPCIDPTPNTPSLRKPAVPLHVHVPLAHPSVRPTACGTGARAPPREAGDALRRGSRCGCTGQVPLSGKLTLKRGADGLIVSYREERESTPSPTTGRPCV